MLKKINHLWRLFSTGLSFTIFGIGGLILGGLIFPVLLSLPGNEKKKRDRLRLCVSKCFGAFFWMMHYLGILKYQVRGREVLKNDKSCLVIANHPSLIDVVSLISLYPNACCIVKKELWQNVFMKKVVSGVGYIPNDDPEALLKACSESMDRGDVLIIFPEGTRTVPGKEMVLQRGAAHVALRLGRPMRTIQIDVNPFMLTKNQPWYSIPERRADFNVTVKELLDVQEYLEHKVPPTLAARRLTQRIRENIDIGLTKASI